jgi:hypothetical protein
VVLSCIIYLPENLWVFLKNGRFLGGDLRVGVKEEIFNPTNITIRANFLVSVAKRVRRSSLVFLRLGEVKEVGSKSFQFGHDFHWNSMIYQLEESKLFTGLDYESLGMRVCQVYNGYLGKQSYRLACFDN